MNSFISRPLGAIAPAATVLPMVKIVGAVGKVKIQPLLRDFQAEAETAAFGLFHEAAFSTALLPTNSAKEPYFGENL